MCWLDEAGHLGVIAHAKVQASDRDRPVYVTRVSETAIAIKNMFIAPPNHPEQWEKDKKYQRFNPGPCQSVELFRIGPVGSLP